MAEKNVEGHDPSDPVEKLARILAFNMHKNVGLKGQALIRHLNLLLAEGRPVSIERISALLNQPPDEVATLLHRLPDIEFDEYGDIIGAGLTLHPTPHRLTINDRTVFAWCALDTLIFPGVIEQTVQVESSCVTTGIPVRIKVTPWEVEQIKPSKTVVSIVTASLDSSKFRSSFCCHVNFFSSDEAASQWLSEHPYGITLPVREAYRLGKLLAATVFQNP